MGSSVKDMYTARHGEVEHHAAGVLLDGSTTVHSIYCRAAVIDFLHTPVPDLRTAGKGAAIAYYLTTPAVDDRSGSHAAVTNFLHTPVSDLRTAGKGAGTNYYLITPAVDDRSGSHAVGRNVLPTPEVDVRIAGNAAIE